MKGIDSVSFNSAIGPFNEFDWFHLRNIACLFLIILIHLLSFFNDYINLNIENKETAHFTFLKKNKPKHSSFKA